MPHVLFCYPIQGFVTVEELYFRRKIIYLSHKICLTNNKVRRQVAVIHLVTDNTDMIKHRLNMAVTSTFIFTTQKYNHIVNCK